MASSEKKRAREQRAAARRDRVVEKRLEKAAERSRAGAAPGTDREEMTEQTPGAAPAEGDA